MTGLIWMLCRHRHKLHLLRNSFRYASLGMMRYAAG
jgi:hypothetical protein